MAAAAAADASKPASKKAAPGSKTPWLWRTSKVQNHAKKLPNVSSEILEKQHIVERFCCLRLLAELVAAAAAADAGKTASKKAAPGSKTPWLWRTSKVQNHAKKLPNVSSEILEKKHLSREIVEREIVERFCRLRLLAGLVAAAAAADAGQTALKKAAPGSKTPWLWWTSKV